MSLTTASLIITCGKSSRKTITFSKHFSSQPVALIYGASQAPTTICWNSPWSHSLKLNLAIYCNCSWIRGPRSFKRSGGKVLRRPIEHHAWNVLRAVNAEAMLSRCVMPARWVLNFHLFGWVQTCPFMSLSVFYCWECVDSLGAETGIKDFAGKCLTVKSCF